MKKRDILVAGALLVIAVLVFVATAPARSEKVVRGLLGGSSNPEIAAAKKVIGGREPLYRGIVLKADSDEAVGFCKSLGLSEETEVLRRESTLMRVQAAFGNKFTDSTNQVFRIYLGTLKSAPFATEAVIGEKQIYFLFSRY